MPSGLTNAPATFSESYEWSVQRGLKEICIDFFRWYFGLQLFIENSFRTCGNSSKDFIEGKIICQAFKMFIWHKGSWLFGAHNYWKGSCYGQK